MSAQRKAADEKLPIAGFQSGEAAPTILPMNNTQLNDDLTVFIARDGAQLVTDSRAVALAFGKRHKNVLQTIDRMRDSKHPEITEHYGLNFQPTSFEVPGPKGGIRTVPMYKMTAKGMSELAMSFTGDNARAIRIRFVNAFEEVANRLARAEKSITERLFDLERRELPSKFKGKVGSLLMNQRKREKPALEEERAALEAIAQPALPGISTGNVGVNRSAASNDPEVGKVA